MTDMLTRRNILTLAAVSTAALAVTAGNPAWSEDAAKPAATPVPGTPADVKIPESAGKVDPAKLMEQGPLKDIVMGKADAPVTIIEYASMTCPHCAHFTVATLPAIKEKYIDTGKAKLILREFPFDPRAAAAFMLARCAPEDRYYPLVDVLFKQQEQWAASANAVEPLMQISKLAGFTQESFNACLTNQKLLDDVNASRDRGAKDFGVNATPTFFINGTKYAGALSVDEMSAIIDGLL
ncbi:DsbA family protein [Phyllobacterium sp. 22229]|uniref:Disulfide bond formation protein DsbA n=1 Tax=Phyllobacterium myrsinacearum TaxID=28101 RepID=A0A2S9JBD4_9HYPH|nr:DsbA family protein [Phyllobacterium myrsinacearum]PRD50140.1 disulfide bond formation protein DsbA [Phyllobacterium myrsinacearum]PWV90807.1 protein-disulfide isomerase [Phyllobacterium myrsinacearum]RZS88391.1 protein-disulfide isomerase [Phyllobacterium myrsinacearum]RZU97209.1 protein-disulfide isomerase [Phyllobacterium myrsinacearum]